jgi:hypothetical protein
MRKACQRCVQAEKPKVPKGDVLPRLPRDRVLALMLLHPATAVVSSTMQTTITRELAVTETSGAG